jgi:predicted DNA-binding transcriptional regulator AlpA
MRAEEQVPGKSIAKTSFHPAGGGRAAERSAKKKDSGVESTTAPPFAEKRLDNVQPIVNDHGRMKIYSSARAAKELGLTPSAITKYIKAGKIPRPKTMEGGNRYLWTDQEIEHVRKLLPKIANGRKTRYQKLREKQKAQARVPVPHRTKTKKKK